MRCIVRFIVYATPNPNQSDEFRDKVGKYKVRERGRVRITKTSNKTSHYG